ncbi:tRNA pseudouridine32 synthase / 23S rRNA pseudouridine746 synthase [Oceanospirillum multiglobuliferum]|uniref:RNA pseudouridine synthase n=1 Tax=Oceanospirillum multiglobuliferum TaxID=64969 RepID=A0A1T4PPU3_9GAMM|nr:RluA family pseudouridine synthase [Oceanospirillum multiglobuliferum]OPX55392.1 RNA pseudouridine synthase [Oceanospirillum multiglobuliferum]SJZ93237.1 tRNA pseudouridine32 synthase / 23S rRNA pseudouridine746 synthase [Oceanospirillum multiglobuliferum]
MTTEITELSVLAASQEAYQLIHQDEDFIVVNKPTKLLSVPGRHPDNHDCLVSRVQQAFPTAMIVHRLDYDTSGLMILPLNKPCLSHISKQFQARVVKKQYTAIVNGLVLEDEGVIDLPIGKDEANPRCYKICQQAGKASVTQYQVLERDEKKQQTRILLKPVTGRSHQLRLHMQALGHVILGDEFYASAELFSASPRLLLHSNRIEFFHPRTNEWLRFDTEVPF